MIESMYVIPSIFAIAVKILFLLAGGKALKEVHICLLAFFLTLFVVNVCELALFSFSDSPDDGFTTLSIYYAFAVMACGSLFAFALHIKGWGNRYSYGMIAVIYAIAVVASLVPGLGLDSAKSIGYSITRVPGELYWVLQLSLVLGLVSALTVFVVCANSTDPEIKKRGKWMLISTTPLVTIVVFVVFAMQIGGNFNASFFVSLATSVMMGVLICSEVKHGFFRFLIWVPGSGPSRNFKKFCETLGGARSFNAAMWERFSIVAGTQTAGVSDKHLPRLVELIGERKNLKEAQAIFTQLYVETVLDEVDGHVETAANILKTSKSTVRRAKT